MYIPTATYRIQLNKDFTFANLASILDYLNALGVSTIYASPILKARPGSAHGYDGVNADEINPEIGTEEEFEEISKNILLKGMGWLQDIAPNHMAYHHDNAWLVDILEKGPQSRYYRFFDINWNDPDPKYRGKIMTPFLGGSLQEALSRNELKIAYDENGFSIHYFENRYPLSIGTYELILNQCKTYFSDQYDLLDPLFQSYVQLVEKAVVIAQDNSVVEEEWETYKSALYQFYSERKVFRNAIETVLKKINTDQASLLYLLERQNYVLSHWQVTEGQINYRRFFTINDLICLDINNPEVFERYHRFLKRLWEKQLIQGLRIDHIDGMFNPGRYLQRLRNLFGDELYIVIEKILEWEESLPLHWPAQGATGYGFLSTISHLFTDWRNKDKLTRLYYDFIGEEPDYHSLVAEKKYFILTNRMKGELNNLFHQMKMLNLMPDGFMEARLKEALAAFLVMHPVYRIYPTQYPLHQRDVNILRTAYNEAVKWRPELFEELSFLFSLFTEPPSEDGLYAENKLYYLMRCEQYTGPLEAKGVEDTTFYLYNRLISHNEVGDSPDIFGISLEEFHERMIERQFVASGALNATATHDTKRGEDMRLRMNVVSELPDEWEQNVRHWRELNKVFKKNKDGREIPEANDEYFIYQTLCGVYPMEGGVDETFVERIKNYMMKVVREGKRNSNWGSPDQIYEFGVFDFIKQILDEKNPFLKEALPFIRKISRYGMIYSLTQTLLKTTVPGVPDVYQGCELWDLSLVDPDNRRAVDYELRWNMLQDIRNSGDMASLIRVMTDNWTSGKIKLFTLFKILQERKDLADLFRYGRYIPAQVEGDRKRHAIGFYRNYNDQWSLSAAPRRLSSIMAHEEMPLSPLWRNTHIRIPSKAPKIWKNVFTDETYAFDDLMYFKDIFAHFPVVFLTGLNA